jgi:glutaredoxin
MENPRITAYLKTHCGWSNGVRAVLAKYELAYEEKDVIQNPAFRWEMEQKSGQEFSPCIDVNGEMLADFSGEELETYLIKNGLVTHISIPTDFRSTLPAPPDGERRLGPSLLSGLKRGRNAAPARGISLATAGVL